MNEAREDEVQSHPPITDYATKAGIFEHRRLALHREYHGISSVGTPEPTSIFLGKSMTFAVYQSMKPKCLLYSL